jgi:hypothetical protein
VIREEEILMNSQKLLGIDWRRQWQLRFTPLRTLLPATMLLAGLAPSSTLLLGVKTVL